MSPDYFRERSTIDRAGCWIWGLRLDVKGYGRMTFRGSPGYLAHRAAYEAMVGPIPPGMTIDHLCYQPACINPAHLEVASLENNQRRQRSAVKTHCIRGHEFTPENTYARTDRSSGRRSCRACNADAVARYQAKRSVA